METGEERPTVEAASEGGDAPEPSTPHVAPSTAVGPAGADGAAESSAPVPNIIMNLAGSLETVTPAWKADLQALLREVADVGDIVIVRVDPGSIHVSLFDPGDALLRIGRRTLADALQERMGMRLIGIARTADIQQAQLLVGKFRRASRDLLAWPQTLPEGQKIERPEFDTIRSRIEGDEPSTTVLLGVPGAGKSALLASIADHYSDEGWPVLAIKADAIDPAVATEAELGVSLGLPGPPGALIEKIAAFDPCFSSSISSMRSRGTSISRPRG